MERGAGGHHQQQQFLQQQQFQHQQQMLEQQQQQQAHQYIAATRSYDSYIADVDSGLGELPLSTSSFDIAATSASAASVQKKKPPKLKSINRSISMAIDNYAPPFSSGGGGGDSAPQLMLDDSLIIEQPLIHRSASPVALRSAPPQSLALPAQHSYHAHYSSGSGAISPTLSARQQHQVHQHHQLQQQQQHQHQQQHQQQHMHSFQHLAATAQTMAGSSSTSSPTLYAVSPVKNAQREPSQPDQIYLVSSSSLGPRSTFGGSTSPIQFIDDAASMMMLPSTAAVAVHRGHHVASATHPLKKTMFRRSDTIDVHPSANFQMKKTHSFHVQQDSAAATSPAVEQLRLAASAVAASGGRRTSSVRGNFLMPGTAGGKDVSRSPSPNRRGCRSHRSFNDPGRRPSVKPESVVESQIRHPSLNDDLMESIDGRPALLFPQVNLSLEDQLFIEASRSRSNSHNKIENAGLELPAPTAQMLRKSSGSFEDTVATASAVAAAASSLKLKREQQQARQQSSHSLELDGGRVAVKTTATTHPYSMHSAAAATTAAYHFKRAAQHGRSLYLSPNNLEELQVHRPGVIAAAAAFQGTNASANVKQAKAMHSASMRLRTYRENLSASKKSKSFISDSGAYQPAAVLSASGSNEFELTSPLRRNSRPLTSSTAAAVGAESSIDEIKRSPRPLAPTVVSTTAFMEEKRPSFERKPSLTFEISDAAFASQVLRPFHHKLAVGGRKESMSSAHKSGKKISIGDEVDDDEEVDRKRKRIVCIVLTVFLCLVCAGVFVVIVTVSHGQTQHPQHNLHQQPGKKVHLGGSRDTPVHYTVRLENDRIKETLDRARYSKNITDSASLVATQQHHGP